MPLPYLPETPSQTAGPYVHIGLIPHQAGFDIFNTNFSHRVEGGGPRIRIEGRVFDGLGQVCRDVLLELWQADAEGRFDVPGFRGWARTGTAFDTGVYAFETVMPGVVDGRPGHHPSAPHASLWIAARGMNMGLQTRVYFEGEDANGADPVLNLIEPARRSTLIARREDRGGVPTYVFDIRLSGDNETVFFDA